jgi:hypothetical protein
MVTTMRRYKVTGLEFNIPVTVYYAKLGSAKNLAQRLEKPEIRDIVTNTVINLDDKVTR